MSSIRDPYGTAATQNGAFRASAGVPRGEGRTRVERLVGEPGELGRLDGVT